MPKAVVAVPAILVSKARCGRRHSTEFITEQTARDGPSSDSVTPGTAASIRLEQPHEIASSLLVVEMRAEPARLLVQSITGFRK